MQSVFLLLVESAPNLIVQETATCDRFPSFDGTLRVHSKFGTWGLDLLASIHIRNCDFSWIL